jgi:hypothetical protein
MILKGKGDGCGNGNGKTGTNRKEVVSGYAAFSESKGTELYDSPPRWLNHLGTAGCTGDYSIQHLRTSKPGVASLKYVTLPCRMRSFLLLMQGKRLFALFSSMKL